MQVTGSDKNGRISDVENYALLSIGAKEALKEFLGPRANHWLSNLLIAG